MAMEKVKVINLDIQLSARGRLRKLFSIKKISRTEEKRMLTARFSSVFRRQENLYSRTYSHTADYTDRLSQNSFKNNECFKSWLLSIFVKIFD